MTLAAPERFRRWLAWYFFLYGCAGTVAVVAWGGRSLSTGAPDIHKLIFVGFLVCCGAAYVFTMPYVSTGFHGLLSNSFPVDPVRMQPVLRVTPSRIRFARWVLVGVAANAAWWFGAAAHQMPRATESAVIMVLCSFAGAYHVYIALHWAFRPQHLFVGTMFEWLLGRDRRERLREARFWMRQLDQQKKEGGLKDRPLRSGQRPKARG